MKGFGRMNIVIGIDSHYCAECGAPEAGDGCSNAACWRARSNARLPIALALHDLAIERCLSSGVGRHGFFHRLFHSLYRTVPSPG